MINILIVTYNTPICKGDTLVSITNIFAKDRSLAKSFGILIWDNSSRDRVVDVSDFLNPFGIEYEYKSTPKNLYLSEIYNKCAASLDPFKYLMILDQDTNVTEAYLREALLLALQGHHLILPRIYSKGRLVSPASRFYCKGRLLRTIQAGQTSSKNLLAINSGMVIDSSIFDKFLYHTDLHFYGTDTWFMVNYERHFQFVTIMNSELHHSLHIDSLPEKAWLKKYFQEQIRVNQIIFSDGWILRIFTWFYNSYLKIIHA
jgi:hypothetical protein